MQAIFDLYQWDISSSKLIQQGLINQSWEIQTKQGGAYILQTINHQVFKQPAIIDENINLISHFLRANHPGYLFTHLVPNILGQTLTYYNNHYYRAFQKVNGIALDLIDHLDQAKEAASAFAKFTQILVPLHLEHLKISLPHFHDLTLRYQQFEQALVKGDPNRIQNAKEVIQYLQSQSPIVNTYQQFIHSKEAMLRVTHHDTKISNILFDSHNKALCVIDLDTVMPGYFISDLGDMCRTYLCKVTEEEKDLNKVQIEKGRWEAIRDGYLSFMQMELSNFELDHFAFAGQFMIYMQALRFITDHLNRDVYYGAKYDGQNYVRAINQMQLLINYSDQIL